MHCVVIAVGKTCFFIGHREASDALARPLENAVRNHIEEYGITGFLVGHYDGFDLLATKAVIHIKETLPHIRLFLLIPYHPAERPVKLPDGFDDSLYFSGMERVPKRAAIMKANRLAIDRCSHLIAFAWHPASNARNLLDYALRRERRGLIHVLNLADTHPTGKYISHGSS